MPGPSRRRRTWWSGARHYERLVVRIRALVGTICIVHRYAIQLLMILSFRHKGIEAFYHSGTTRGIQAAHAKKLRNILAMLDVAARPEDMNLPSFRLHPLKGDMKGFWSIWVNGNWRVTFRFVGADTELVDYQDYH